MPIQTDRNRFRETSFPTLLYLVTGVGTVDTLDGNGYPKVYHSSVILTNVRKYRTVQCVQTKFCQYLAEAYIRALIKRSDGTRAKETPYSVVSSLYENSNVSPVPFVGLLANTCAQNTPAWQAHSVA